VGINPFTKKPMEFHGHPDSARVTLADAEIGAIYWAMDGSRCLVVNSNAGSEGEVITIAPESPINWAGGISNVARSNLRWSGTRHRFLDRRRESMIVDKVASVEPARAAQLGR
jgi:hypothetical protein